MMLKPNTGNGLQEQMTEHQLPTAVAVAQLPLNFKKGKYSTSIHAF
jgi:hypothetical protein